MLYKSAEDQIKKLHMYEGFLNFYEHKVVEAVTEDGRKIEAITYVKTKKEPYFKPSKKYVKTIIKGFRAHRYPNRIIQEGPKKIRGFSSM